MKRLYYFERIVSYSGDKIKVNRFKLYFSLDLIEKLGLCPDNFYNQVLQYKHPIIIVPKDTLEYRTHLLGHLLDGKYPRLKSEINFMGGKSKISINPFMTVNRIYALQQDTLMLRCSFSYLD